MESLCADTGQLICRRKISSIGILLVPVLRALLRLKSIHHIERCNLQPLILTTEWKNDTIILLLWLLLLPMPLLMLMSLLLLLLLLSLPLLMPLLILLLLSPLILMLLLPL